MLFLIKNLKVARTNLLMNDYCAGLPSPLACLGFAESIARDFNLAPWSVKVLPILHDVYASHGRTKPEMEGKGSVFSQIEIIEDFHGIVDISLVIDLPGFESAADLLDVVVYKPFCGGMIQNHHVEIEVSQDDGSILRKCRRGFALVAGLRPETCVMSHGDRDEILDIARTVFPTVHASGSGWLVPVAVGHHLLEDPASTPLRWGARDASTPHVFVEPCVGIAEFMSVRNPVLKDANQEDFSKIMWSWTTTEDLVLAHPAYAKNETGKTN